MNTIEKFQQEILLGIPQDLPEMQTFDPRVNRAPVRRHVLSAEKKRLALANALRYFPKKLHAVLADEFAQELIDYGHIYMYRYRPSYKLYARPINHYPAKSQRAAAIMMMIHNNLDEQVAQHPYELITYGGNGSVFQNWAQYRLTMQYLAYMSEEQTLALYSGHPLGLFPSQREAPRVVVTNGMVVPNYSSKEELDRLYALGVSQYGQMTAGSFMYIGPQGIVHGTTITLMNALRKQARSDKQVPIFISSGLGGMSGAQPKASTIAGMIAIIAEVNEKAIETRMRQGWVDEIEEDADGAIDRALKAQEKQEIVSIAYSGNIVDLLEAAVRREIFVDVVSDQTSLHNPHGGGYYPVGIALAQAKELIRTDPDRFDLLVQASLRRQVEAINQLVDRGTYFFDYGNAFLLEASRAQADILDVSGQFRYHSYVQDIMGPLFFDYGFGPFRWVCSSCDPEDLSKTDVIASKVLRKLYKTAPQDIRQQIEDNIHWIEAAAENELVVGSQARILYADSQARIAIALAFHEAICKGEISAPIVLGRDHHDVSGTDSPYRETSNIYDGSAFTADMAVHNVIGDASRGATWVSLHNGGGVGWGEVINGGFGLVVDDDPACKQRIKDMLLWDVNNGIARRSWARNAGAIAAIEREMERNGRLKVTIPYCVDEEILSRFK